MAQGRGIERRGGTGNGEKDKQRIQQNGRGMLSCCCLGYRATLHRRVLHAALLPCIRSRSSAASVREGKKRCNNPPRAVFVCPPIGWPAPLCSACALHSCLHFHSLRRTFSQSLLVCFREGLWTATPALLTSTSIGPRVSSTCSRRRGTKKQSKTKHKKYEKNENTNLVDKKQHKKTKQKKGHNSDEGCSSAETTKIVGEEAVW